METDHVHRSRHPKNQKNKMTLFEGLRKIREFERLQFAYLKSMVDFDLIIEIGFAEEQGEPLTLKQLLLLNISSRTTLRRRLAFLIDKGVIVRRRRPDDQRATHLTISPASLKALSKYGAAISSISSLHFG
jgi:DNA-binding MarR family transcriptional regulator